MYQYFVISYSTTNMCKLQLILYLSIETTEYEMVSITRLKNNYHSKMNKETCKTLCILLWLKGQCFCVDRGVMFSGSIDLLLPLYIWKFNVVKRGVYYD